MAFIILNNSYDLLEISYDTPNLKKIIEHIRDMKNEICNRNESLDKEESNIPSDFISTEVGLIKHNERFSFIIYQNGLYYDKQTKRPTAILIAKKASNNKTYIVTLLCRHQNTEKGFGKLLIDKLIEKARKIGIEYIYLESINNSRLFYKTIGFESDSEKNIHTDSERNEELTGYLLNVNNKEQNNINMIGGNINNYQFVYDNRKIIIYDNLNNKNILGKIIYEPIMHPLLLYIDLEIVEIISNNNETNDILITIFDNMCKKNYINKSYMLLNEEDTVFPKKRMGDFDKIPDKQKELLLNHGYEYHKKKMLLCMYEKTHNEKYIIDRTILSYNKS